LAEDWSRIAELIAIRDQSQADAERAIAAIERLEPEITPDSLKRFASAARRQLKSEDGTYRRGHLRVLAQRGEMVSKSEIRLMDLETELLRTLAAAASVGPAVVGVRRIVLKWRARRVSNS
jgi:site-specific DNA recombinase